MAAGVSITVFALHYPFTEEVYRWNSVKVIPLNGANNRWKKRFTLKRKLFRLLDAEQVETPFVAIHAFWLQEATVWSVEWARKRAVSCIATAMGQEVQVSNPYLRRIARSLPDTVITLSEFHAQVLQKAAGITSEIIGFGLTEAVVFDTSKNIDIVGVGNLIAVKNYGYFLEICERLAGSYPHLSVKLIGTGAELELLRQMVIRKGLQANVELLGAKSYEETLMYMAHARVLLHPSQFEGYGMIFAEALAARTHIAAFPVGIALQEDLREYLTRDAVKDAAFVGRLLIKVPPEINFRSIRDAVIAYQRIYG